MMLLARRARAGEHAVLSARHAQKRWARDEVSDVQNSNIQRWCMEEVSTSRARAK
jgi:hypothetical protein